MTERRHVEVDVGSIWRADPLDLPLASAIARLVPLLVGIKARAPLIRLDGYRSAKGRFPEEDHRCRLVRGEGDFVWDGIALDRRADFDVTTPVELGDRVAGHEVMFPRNSHETTGRRLRTAG